MSRQRNIVSPSLIRGMFGGSLKILWFPEYRDASGNVRDLSATNHAATPTAVTYKERPLSPQLVARSGRFDGSTSRLTTASHTDFNAPVDVELDFFMWVMLDELPGTATRLVSKEDSTAAAEYHLSVAANGELQGYTSDGVVTLTANSGITLEAEKPYLIRWKWTRTSGVDDKHEFWVNSDYGTESGAASLGEIAVDGDLAYMATAGGTEATAGVLHAAGLVRGGAPSVTWDRLLELSGVEAPLAPYLPGYVSDYSTSPRHYFADYANDYLTYVSKPAVDVYPKRRYGEATARGIKGAHDGSLQAGTDTAGGPSVDDYGLALKTDADSDEGISVAHSTDFEAATFTAIYTGTPTSDDHAFSKRANAAGWRGRFSAGQWRFSVNDGTNNVEVASTAANAEPHLVAGGVQATGEVFAKADAQTRTVGAAAPTPFANTEPVELGYGHFSGLAGRHDCFAYAPYELTDSELDHLNVVAFDRTKRPQLDLSLPDYLAPFSGNIEHWSAHRKFKRFAAGDPVEHLTSFVEGSHGDQGTAANRPTYTASGIRFDGDDHSSIVSFTQSPTEVLWAAVIEVEAGGIVLWHGDSDSPAIELGVVGSPLYARWRIRDSDVKEIAIGSSSISSVTVGERYVVMGYGALGGAQELWLNDASGPVGTASRADTGNWSATKRLVGVRDTGTGPSSGIVLDKMEALMIEGGSTTQQQRADLMAALMAEHGVS